MPYNFLLLLLLLLFQVKKRTHYNNLEKWQNKGWVGGNNLLHPKQQTITVYKPQS